MGLTVQASNGTMLPIDSLPQVFTYNGDNLAAITVFYAGTFYQQTFTYNGSQLIAVSRWNVFDPGTLFISTWDTTLSVGLGASSSNQIQLPLQATGIYDFFISWGDGKIDHITAYNQAEVTHTYDTPGEHTLTIFGTIRGFRFNNGGDAVKLLNISQWGALKLGNSDSYFYGCSNLVITATDTLNLTGTTTLKNAFRACAALTSIPSLTSWDFSAVTSLESIFQDAVLYDQSLNGIDTSSVTTLKAAFFGALAFNGDVSALNTSACTDMSFCFANTNIFNKSVASWDFSSVTTVESMFNTAIAYDKSLAGINTASITTFKNFLYGAVSFNSSVAGFDFSACDDCTAMFKNSQLFNQPLTSWANFATVEKMDEMFLGAQSFNQSLADLDISGLLSAADMLDAPNAYSVDNYDALLFSWSQQTVQPNVILGITVKYKSAYQSYRDILTNSPNTWTINDDGVAPSTGQFISVWDTEATGELPGNATIKLPLVASGTYDFDIDWGDGNIDTITAYDQAEVTHVYADPGIYTISIDGTIRGICFKDDENVPYSICINEIKQWGGLRFGNTGGYFYNTYNMLITATDAPDLTGTTSFKEAFKYAAITTVPGIASWNISAITTLESCFEGCWQFNQSLDAWNVSNIVSMKKTFMQCQAYNNPLSSWSTPALTDTSFMFCQAEAFNQSLNNFTMNLVTTTESMFDSAPAFNNDIWMWTLPACLNMSRMFANATSFNKNFVTTGHWHTPLVQDFSGFMLNAAAFAMPLDLLDVSSCRNFSQMFRQASSFDQPLPSWNFQNAENLTEMFRLCPFNQATPWDFSNGPNLSLMFYQSSFNAVPGFDVSACSVFDYMFAECSFNQDLSGFNMSNAVSAEGMFQNNAAFDQDLGNWDVSNITNLSLFLDGATLSTANYNALLVGWAAQTVQPNLTFNGGNSHYDGAGVAARATLTSAPNNWVITDGGTP